MGEGVGSAVTPQRNVSGMLGVWQRSGVFNAKVTPEHKRGCVPCLLLGLHTGHCGPYLCTQLLCNPREKVSNPKEGAPQSKGNIYFKEFDVYRKGAKKEQETPAQPEWGTMTFTEPGHCVKGKIPQDCVCPRNQTVYGPRVKTLKDWKPELPGLNPVTK